MGSASTTCPQEQIIIITVNHVIHIENLLNKIKQMKIKYFFGKINESTDKMINDDFKAVSGHKTIQYTDL